MFLMDWRYAAGTIGCQLLLGLFIYYRSDSLELSLQLTDLTINCNEGNLTLTGAVLQTL